MFRASLGISKAARVINNSQLKVQYSLGTHHGWIQTKKKINSLTIAKLLCS
jgi:hypothetical protein